MTSEIIKIKNSAADSLRKKFLPELNKELTEQKIFSSKIKDLVLDLKLKLEDEKNKSASPNLIEKFTSDLIQEYKSIIPPEDQEFFDERYFSLIEEFQKITEPLSSQITELQKEENFSTSEKTIYIRTLNNFKKAAFVSYKPIFITQNFAKKIFKKETQGYIWKRKVHLKEFVKFHLNCLLKQRLIELENETKKIIARNYLKHSETLNKLDDGIYKYYSGDAEDVNFYEDDFDEIKAAIDERIKINRNETEKIIEEEFAHLSERYLIAGTVEYPSRKYSASTLTKCLNKLSKKRKIAQRHFYYYETSVIEKIIFIEEIANTVYAALNLLVNSEQAVKNRLAEKVVDHFRTITESLEESKNRLAEKTENFSALKRKIRKEKIFLEDKLNNQIILPFVDILPVDMLLDPLKDFNIQIEKRINAVPEEVHIVQKEDLNFDIKESDIDIIYLRDIIKSTALYHLTKKNSALIYTADTELKRQSGKIIEISQVTDYNLETAVSLIEQKDEKSEAEIIEVAVEGITRAELKSEELKNGIAESAEELINKIEENVFTFNSDIRELKNTEELLRLKIKVSKEKTSAHIKKNVESGVSTIKDLFPKAVDYIKAALKESADFIGSLRNRFGIGGAAQQISVEITDFLAETEKIFAQLPVVYQRLFRQEALTDERFRTNREDEIASVAKAYSSWHEGRFSSTVLIGEKGAGASTVLNFALPDFDKKISIIRKRLKNNIFTEDELLQLISEIFETDAPNIEAAVDSVNSESSKKIVILENFEELFLRTVNGFSALRKMFEIISVTHKNIFWIATCNTYAWNYLDRVLNISDYFSFIIKLRNMKDQEIESAIMKRHRVSGYNLHFLPAEEDSKSKNFKKLSEKEKQEFLTAKYFSLLNRNSNSNIALAQLLWLRSIKNLKEEELQISSLKDLDFSFIKNLDEKKLFTLMALILHEGLTIEEHSLVFNQSQGVSRLHLYGLADDGIITKNENIYKVNFLLYGQVINILRDKNIIH